MACSSLVSYMIVVLFIACVSVCYCYSIGTDKLDHAFGECKPDQMNSCRDCYFELVRSVLGRDDNVFSLSQVFTPPLYDGPSYVTISYHFVNECVNATDYCVDETDTWFWAKSGAYLLYPLGTFQFISLLFGNPEPLYERKVNVTLNATECYDVPPKYMTLLTQRLKIHVQEQSLYPKMDDSYVPLAANNTTVIEILQNAYYSRGTKLSSEHILFLCPIAATILVLIIIVIVVVLHICKWKKSVRAGLKSQTKVNILSVSIICFDRIVIFFIIDNLALAYECPLQGSDPNGATILCELTHLLNKVPLTLMLSDLVLLVFGTCFLVAFFIISCKDKKDLHYYIISLIVVCFILSCLMHAPYITMAYLSDAHYATSVLVYYMTILFIEFGLIQYTIKTYFHLKKHSNDQRSNKTRRLKFGFTSTLTFNLFALILLVYTLVITVSIFLYHLPLINLFSNLPNEGIVVYQTALVMVGAYVTYKTLFKEERDQQKLHAILNLKRKIKKSEIAVLKSEIAVLKDETEIDEVEIKNKRNMTVYLQIEIEIMLIQSNIMRLIEGPDTRSRKAEIWSLECQEKANLDKLNEQTLSQIRDIKEHLKSDYELYMENIKERQKVYGRPIIIIDNEQDPNNGQPHEEPPLGCCSSLRQALRFRRQSNELLREMNGVNNNGVEVNDENENQEDQL